MLAFEQVTFEQHFYTLLAGRGTESQSPGGLDHRTKKPDEAARSLLTDEGSPHSWPEQRVSLAERRHW